jgi:hypothetical protein
MAFIEAYIFDPTTHGPAELMWQRYDYELRQSTWQPKRSSASVVIMDSNDNEIYSDNNAAVIGGTTAFTWKIPKDTNGGEYTIKVSGEDFPCSYRKFRVNQFSQPELFVTLDFEKQNYSLGDKVVAKVKVRRPDGEALAPGSSIAYEVPMITASGKSVSVSEKMLELNG